MLVFSQKKELVVKKVKINRIVQDTRSPWMLMRVQVYLKVRPWLDSEFLTKPDRANSQEIKAEDYDP